MAQITQTRTIADLAGGGTGSLYFDSFDPALGTFNGATLTLATTLAGSAAAENLDLAPANLAVGLQAGLIAYLYGGSYAPYYYFNLPTGTATASGSATLAAYDGTADFAGASGIALAGLAGTHTDTVAIPAGDSRAGIFSLGTGFQLGLSAAAGLGLSAGANLRLQTDVASIGVEATLTYDYTPPGTTGGSVTTTTNPPATLPAPPVTVPSFTTARQVHDVAAQATGWTSAFTVDGFDPSWGTLVGVNLRLANTLTGSVAVENHSTRYGRMTTDQHLVTALSMPGQSDPLLAAQADNVSTFYPGVADGTDDFAGSGGVRSDNLSNSASAATRLTDPAILAAFTGTGPVDLSLHAAGTSIVEGTADLLAELAANASARLELSYTFTPPGPYIAIAMTNGTTGVQSQPTPATYTGPVAGIVNEFAVITTDNIALSAATDSWYIRTGPGTDAIRVVNGTNVVDGGGGSNFLTGGDGQDTFFVDASIIAGPMWNTIAGFSSGDSATIWGITTEGFRLTWLDGLGAPGATGLTLNARAPGMPLVSTTFAGYSTADLGTGRLAISYGVAAGDLPYMNIRAT